MTGFRCSMEDYYQDPADEVTKGIDLGLLKSAHERNSALLQKAMDGAQIDVLPVISQPTVRNFYIERDENRGHRMVYRDSLNEQLRAVEEAIRTDVLIIPMVSCDFNVLSITSAFNPELVPSSDLTDAYVAPVFTSRDQMEKLDEGALNRDLVSLMIKETQRMRSWLPDYVSVGIRINTGPLAIASELRGATEIIYDMLEAPELYHHFMDFVTDYYIEVRKSLHEAAGLDLEEGKVHADVANHTVTNGICICDDNIYLLGMSQFEEFAAPYLSRALQAFGGGTIHSCGDTSRLWPALARLPGLDGFEFGQLDLIDWRKARSIFTDKNLTFYDTGITDEAYVRDALGVMEFPKTFIYSSTTENIRTWHEGFYRLLGSR